MARRPPASCALFATTPSTPQPLTTPRSPIKNLYIDPVLHVLRANTGYNAVHIGFLERSLLEKTVLRYRGHQSKILYIYSLLHVLLANTVFNPIHTRERSLLEKVVPRCHWEG
jgi:hypothetical protein